MLLYWGMFSVGFTIGAVLSFITFAPKKPEEDPEYETPSPDLPAINSSPSDSKQIYALYLPKQAKTRQSTSGSLDVPDEVPFREFNLPAPPIRTQK